MAKVLPIYCTLEQLQPSKYFSKLTYVFDDCRKSFDFPFNWKIPLKLDVNARYLYTYI